MPCAVTAFNVRIASSGDTAMEGVIAREVIYEWNELHAWEQKKALLPTHTDASSSTDSQPDFASDLLVAFFCTSQGVPSDASARGTDQEVERQLKAGRPALSALPGGPRESSRASPAGSASARTVLFEVGAGTADECL